MNRNLWRNSKNAAALTATYLLTGLALVPLGLVLWYTILKGLPAAGHLDFFLNVERPVGIPGSGISNAIVGTAMMVGMASLVAIPVGVISGVYLAEYNQARWATWVRLASDVLVGAPSIALGLFAYAILVVPLHHYSAISASAALSILMLPVVIRTTESAVSLIPGGLRESGLALGLPRWRVSLQLIVPAAAPGVITGALLAVARAAGETAPLLFHSLRQPVGQRRSHPRDVSTAAHRVPRRADSLQGAPGPGMGRSPGARDDGAFDKPGEPVGPAPPDPPGRPALAVP